MLRRAAAESTGSILRVYLRRSDEGHQQYSIDVQREGSRMFVAEELPRLGVTVSWSDRVEYIDDDRAGDDFEGRPSFARLRAETKAGDVVLCRDQSRMGRDALEVTLAVRQIVRDRGARLFYYAERKEVEFANAIDAAMTFIKGTGHQMELEAIRSRVREALRSRVRAGRIAGGRCFGYRLLRETDASGRPYTVATVDPVQGPIVVRIFEMYAMGAGLKRIAIALNDERIPPPHAGKRGTGSWSPGAIREMLRNHRYRGVYIHGRIKRVRRGDKRVAVQAPPDEIITVEIPEWRIIDDPLWFMVHEKFAKRAETERPAPGPRSRYALSGLARCEACGGSIGAQNTKVAEGVHGKAYGCEWHNKRGSTVCGVKVRQAVELVERRMIDHIANNYLTENVIAEIMDRLRANLERQFDASKVDTAALEQELAQMRAEQRNLATAVATGGDAIPELVGELRKRNERIRQLDNDLAAAKRSPELAAKMLAEAEEAVRGQILHFRETLQERREDVREVLQAIFPEGYRFREAKRGNRRIWAVRATAQLGGFSLKSDPTGT